METSDRSELEHVLDLARSFPTAMLVTHSATGGMHGRPMEVAEVSDDCSVWFYSGVDTAKTHEIEEDRAAMLIFQKDHTAYLTMGGTATLSRNRTRIDSLWKEGFKAWFPGGKDDPNLVVIAFRPQRAEYWDTTGVKKLSYLWQTATAYVTGTRPEIKEGEQHGSVKL